MSDVRILYTRQNERVETTMTDDEAAEILRGCGDESEFVTGLLDRYKKYGSRTTPNSLAWMHKRALEEVARMLSGGVPAEPKRAYQRAASLALRSAGPVTFLIDGFRFQLSRSRERGRSPGCVWVSNGGKKRGGDNVLFGSLNAKGFFTPGRAFPPGHETPKQIEALLARLDANPDGFAREYMIPNGL